MPLSTTTTHRHVKVEFQFFYWVWMRDVFSVNERKQEDGEAERKKGIKVQVWIADVDDSML